MSVNAEKEFLEEVSYTYKNENSIISKWSIDSYINIYKKYILKMEGINIGLEMGCSNGYSTEQLSELLDELYVIDGSENMLLKASQKIKKSNIHFEYGLFEELTDKKKYDYIFCSYVLEHVMDPKIILEICYEALKDNGKLFITVPNARAISRQMALKMGLIDNLYALTENDLAHGHRRVFDLTELKELLENSRFYIVDIGGTFFKPFADFQLNQMIAENIIGEEQLKGMQKLAKSYPDLSGSIYAVVGKSEKRKI